MRPCLIAVSSSAPRKLVRAHEGGVGRSGGSTPGSTKREETSASLGPDAELGSAAGAGKLGLGTAIGAGTEPARAGGTRARAITPSVVRMTRDDTCHRMSRLEPVIVNRDPKARGPYTAFAGVAGAYERGRPGYPDDAVRWLVGVEPCDVVDLGAGTGKLTRVLAALGHRVTAVEPLQEMRAELEAALTGVHAVAGSAEAIPLPDSSADAVTSAQAFHWFDHDDALPEIARVLRPGGRLALVWNSRDDRDPWMARLSAIIGNESVEESDVVPVLDESGLFRWVETKSFVFEQVLDRDGLLDLVLSRSYLAKLPPPEREPVLDEVGALYDETAKDAGVRLAYVTDCYRATKAS